MKKLKYNLENTVIDCISKFNFYDKIFIKKLNSLVVFTKLSINDTSFMRDFFFLSKLFFFWFNKKISILQIIKDKKKAFNKGKNSLTFFFGCTIRKNYLYKQLDYINNIIFNLTKKVDGNVKFKKIDSGFVYNFSNINFLLGFKSERFFNLNLKINIFYNFFRNEKKIYKLNSFNKKLINFYEKVFF